MAKRPIRYDGGDPRLRPGTTGRFLSIKKQGGSFRGVKLEGKDHWAASISGIPELIFLILLVAFLIGTAVASIVFS